MYRRDYIELAKAVRRAAEEAALTEVQRDVVVSELVAVCSDRARNGSFDEELFTAYATSAPPRVTATADV